MKQFLSISSKIRLFFFCFTLSLFIFTSCGKKWKKPTDVSFKFQLNNNSSAGLVKFTGGYYTLNRLKFTGDRKQGTHHIELDQTFSGNKQALLFQNPTSAGIKFNVPQGTYKNIELEVDIDGNQTGTSLEITGYYINSDDDTCSVIFDFSADDVLNIPASSSNGGTEIILVEDRPSSGTFIINPNYWFAAISHSSLDDASEDLIDNVKTIFINNHENTDIYNLIIGRVRDGNRLIFE